MPRAMRIRLAAVVITAAICGAWRDAQSTFLWFTYSLGFAHYALALGYSTSQIRAATSTAPQLLSVAGLGLLSLFLYQIDFPLVAYFGLHHALNEAYAGGRTEGWSPGAPQLTAAAVFQAASYLTVLRFSPELAGFNPLWMWPAFVGAGLWYAREVSGVRGQTGRQRLDLCAPEITAAALVVISLFVRVTFMQLVLYHFVLWALLPVARIRARSRAAVARYAALSMAVSGLFLVVSPIGPAPARIATAWFNEQFLFWSYAHITLSFALSNAHPAWVVRLFRDVPARRLAALHVAG